MAPRRAYVGTLIKGVYMLLLISAISVIGCFLAWAVGGEYRFGKGKRGLLLAIPLTFVAIWARIPWYYTIAQVGILFLVYICLFYDDGVKAVYDENKKLLGWTIIYLNGAIIGLSPICIFLGTGSYMSILYCVIASALAFAGVVRLSNDPQFAAYRAWLTANGIQAIPYVDDQGHNGFYINFKDAWWVSEGLMGAALGALAVWLR